MPRKIETTLTFPPKFAKFLEPNPWKIAWGGRGAGKTESFAKLLLFKGTQLPLRILCAREYMASISESVWQTLVDCITDMKLSDFYEIEKSEIRSKKPVKDPDDPDAVKYTTFRFSGIRSNINNIKSMKSIDVCWCEEASGISARSWEVLIPTIHRKGQTLKYPEIWVSFNPDYETDCTYQMFVTNPVYPSALCVNVNWQDNPWFPPSLQLAREQLQLTDPESYSHVYDGQCRKYLAGAIYRNEIRAAEAEGRIRDVHYAPEGGPVQAFFDIGLNDATAIWLAQVVGTEIRVIDFVEATGEALDFYLLLLNDMAVKGGYVIDRLFLPHDARARSYGSGMSVEEILRKKMYKVSIVANLSIEDGIQAMRSMWPSCYWDRRKCAEGLKALGNYRYETMGDNRLDFKNKPRHDQYSHAADAARYMAIALKPPKPARVPPALGWARFMKVGANTNWMDIG